MHLRLIIKWIDFWYFGQKQITLFCRKSSNKSLENSSNKTRTEVRKVRARCVYDATKCEKKIT